MVTRYASPLALEALGIQLPAVADHPNRWPFQGILTRLDEPSTRAPGGSNGHRVIIPTTVAEEALPSLLGMAINLAPDFSGHAKQTKIGLITDASIDGQDLVVSGYLFAQDFPEETARIRTKQADLGMSFEITKVQVANPDAPVWTLTALIFTGAAVLWKHRAAYEQTAIAAESEEESSMDLKAVLAALQAMQTKVDELHTAQATVSMQGQDGAPSGEAGNGGSSLTADDEAVLARICKALSVEATAEPQSPPAITAMDDKHPFMRAMRAMMRYAMTDMPHDDEAEDLAILRRLLKKVMQESGMDSQASPTTPAAPVAPEVTAASAQLQQVIDGMALLTDIVQKQQGLLTDMAEKQTKLLTDGPAASSQNGGPAIPPRKTMAASDAHWLEKHHIDASRTYNTEELDQVLRQNGVTDTVTRMAIKHSLESQELLK